MYKKEFILKYVLRYNEFPSEEIINRLEELGCIENEKFIQIPTYNERVITTKDIRPLSGNLFIPKGFVLQITSIHESFYRSIHNKCIDVHFTLRYVVKGEGKMRVKESYFRIENAEGLFIKTNKNPSTFEMNYNGFREAKTYTAIDSTIYNDID